jgi:hypothetical protein
MQHSRRQPSHSSQLLSYCTGMAAQTSGNIGGFGIFTKPAPHLSLLLRRKVPAVQFAINGIEKC